MDFMKKMRIIAVAFLIGFGIFHIGLIASDIYSNSRKPAKLEFDQTKWNTDIKSRKTMIEDLKNKYDLMQMTRDEILELLGDNSAFISDTYIRYELKSGLLEDDVFSFSFDENGNVLSYGIHN